MNKRIDLHMHSLFSDGELLPSELARRALKLNHEVIAITEHESISNAVKVEKEYNKIKVGVKNLEDAILNMGSYAADIPIVGVHHIMGHVSANFIQHKELEPPFTALIVSGGHTNIAKMESYTECHMLGGTRDDAVGEAYDKVARVLGLGYPGGPKVDKIAKTRLSL